VRDEAFADIDVEAFYQARELLAEWVRYYNERRLHSALKYLRPVDHYRATPRPYWPSGRGNSKKKQPDEGR